MAIILNLLYSGIDREDQKKVLGVFMGCFLGKLIRGGHGVFNFFIKCFKTKSFGKP